MDAQPKTNIKGRPIVTGEIESARRRARRLPTKICAHCGREYTDLRRPNGRSRYCVDCRALSWERRLSPEAAARERERRRTASAERRARRRAVAREGQGGVG